MTAENVIATVLTIAWMLWVGWRLWKYVLRPARNRRRILGCEDDVLLKKVGENLAMLHDVFGMQFRIRTIQSDDGMSIALVCEKCDKVNRLVRGFRGARCGNCKTPFVPQEMRTRGEKEVRLN